MPKPRERGCRQCKEKFQPHRMGQRVCSPECALAQAKDKRVKASDKAHRARKRALLDNDRAHQLKSTQKIVNQFIRLRDQDQPCISCGRHHDGQYHAGHYRPVGNNSALRFNEVNIHRQCSVCNNWRSGQLTDYRVRLIEKVGIDIVEWLEKDHPKTTPWTLEELRGIRQYYQRAIKEMR